MPIIRRPVSLVRDPTEDRCGDQLLDPRDGSSGGSTAFPSQDEFLAHRWIGRCGEFHRLLTPPIAKTRCSLMFSADRATPAQLLSPLGVAASNDGRPGDDWLRSCPPLRDSGRTSSRQPDSQSQPLVRICAYSIDGSSRLIGSGRTSAAQQFQAFQQQAAAQMAQQRVNRVYSIDGTSRPIGSGRQSQPDRMASDVQNAAHRRSFDAGRTDLPTSVYVDGGQGPSGTAGRDSLVFDDNAPRRSTSSSSPAADAGLNNNGPSVAPRQSGSRSQTAAMNLQ